MLQPRSVLEIGHGIVAASFLDTTTYNIVILFKALGSEKKKKNSSCCYCICCCHRSQLRKNKMEKESEMKNQARKNIKTHKKAKQKKIRFSNTFSNSTFLRQNDHNWKCDRKRVRTSLLGFGERSWLLDNGPNFWHISSCLVSLCPPTKLFPLPPEKPSAFSFTNEVWTNQSSKSHCWKISQNVSVRKLEF